MNNFISHLVRGGRVFILALFCVFIVEGAEVLPPKPQHHFNDYAGVVSIPEAQRLDRAMDELEKAESTQLVVAIFPHLPEGAALEDYTVRVFQSWGVGTKKDRNGAILFLFVKEHKVRFEIGYGLEGVMPDAICKRIIDEAITPNLRAGNFDAGLSAGVDAMIKAVHGEYKGTGRTAGQRRSQHRGNLFSLVIFALIILSVINSMRRGRRGTTYGRYGRGGWGGQFIGGGWGGGGWGGGGGGSSGGGGWGGGFSGGGGSSGGGGASGSW